MGSGVVEIVDEAPPQCPKGGLVVKTEACGLCSGELMAWYMDRKIPHVLGHEVAGLIVESDDARFPIGSRVFPHHHAPCLACELCEQGLFVHCNQWKQTKLIPGGMAEFFAVSAENLNDAILVGDMRARDAALIEPLACVMKSLRLSGVELYPNSNVAVIGLGVMGLMHALLLPGCTAFDVNQSRIDHARSIGIDVRLNQESEPNEFSIIFVCPGSQSAFDFALELAQPEARIILFAPLPPNQPLQVPQQAYFRDIQIINSYSCGPNDTQTAFERLKAGSIQAEQVVSEFIAIDNLPVAYGKMKIGETLKPMVVFS